MRRTHDTKSDDATVYLSEISMETLYKAREISSDFEMTLEGGHRQLISRTRLFQTRGLTTVSACWSQKLHVEGCSHRCVLNVSDHGLVDERLT